MGVEEDGSVRFRFEELDVRGEEVGEEEGEVEDEFLVRVGRGFVCAGDVCVRSLTAVRARDQVNGPVAGGTILLTLVMTMLKRMMNLELYSGPIWRPPISERHLRVTLRNSGTSRNCSAV